MKMNMIVIDSPWSFSDELKQSKTKRGASSNYSVLNNNDIEKLDVKSLVDDDAVIALWVPSSLLESGINCIKNYGFSLKQTWVWVKTKQDPKENLKKNVGKILKKKNFTHKEVLDEIDNFDLNDCLNFFMGRTFRQTHEVALIGTRGKCSKYLKDKSQRSVHIFNSLKKHSEKPEELQDRLEKMFPSFNNRLEIFARRVRNGWHCVGNECPATLGEDVRDSINRLKALP